jgi:hypothetical protein
MPPETMNGDWQAVADDLAIVLRTTMLRNPNLAARDWDRAQSALQRYEQAGGQMAPVPTLEESPKG